MPSFSKPSAGAATGAATDAATDAAAPSVGIVLSRADRRSIHDDQVQDGWAWALALRRCGCRVDFFAADAEPRALGLGATVRPLAEAANMMLVVLARDADDAALATGCRCVALTADATACIRDEEQWLERSRGTLRRPLNAHAVWAALPPRHAAYIRTWSRLPTTLVPPVWSPEPLLRAAAAEGKRLEVWRGDVACADGAHVLIVESNDTADASAWLPLVICEAFLLGGGALAGMHLFGPPAAAAAGAMLRYLDVARCVRAYPPTSVVDIAARFASGRSVVALCHAHTAAASSTMLAAAWLGVPLVHNCAELGAAGVGFAYAGNDVDAAAAALQRAAAASMAEHAAKRAAARAWVDAHVSPAAPRVRALLTSALASLCYQ